jgi:hypothetical protein
MSVPFILAYTAWQGLTKGCTDYHGAEAEYLKLQAFQLMLRLQVQELRALWGLPDAFEVSQLR